MELDDVKFHSLYGKISIFQAEFSFAPSILFVQTLIIEQTLIIDKFYKNISMMFALL